MNLHEYCKTALNHRSLTLIALFVCFLLFPEYCIFLNMISLHFMKQFVSVRIISERCIPLHDIIRIYIIIFILQPGAVRGSVPGVRCQKEGQGRLEKGRGEGRMRGPGTMGPGGVGGKVRGGGKVGGGVSRCKLIKDDESY